MSMYIINAVTNKYWTEKWTYSDEMYDFFLLLVPCYKKLTKQLQTNHSFII